MEDIGKWGRECALFSLAVGEVKQGTVRVKASDHRAQVIEQCKAIEMEVCLLLNFVNPKLEFQRVTRYRTVVSRSPSSILSILYIDVNFLRERKNMDGQDGVPRNVNLGSSQFSLATDISSNDRFEPVFRV